MNKPLLPTGCYDLLPPSAKQESTIVHSLLQTFDAYGYEQVTPPLLEYTESLLAGRGAALAAQVFRVMDPGAHKVMGIRADMTLQIARIAATRLQNVPRPLRLCYVGNVLRMQGGRFSAERQLRQAGLELIGATSPQADAEVIAVAAIALQTLGLPNLSIDLNLPGIVSALLADDALEPAALTDILNAVRHKDVATLRASALTHKDLLIACIQAAGPAPHALAQLRTVTFPAAIRRELDALETVHALLAAQFGAHVALTIDPTESRGLEYYTGISFSFFAAESVAALGNGGRYRIDQGAASEEATGFTLYVDTLRKLLPKPALRPRLFMAEMPPPAELRALQDQGYAVVQALPEYGTDADEARNQRCTHLYRNGNVETLS